MEYAAERMYRDSRINRIFEGTNEINRLLIAGTLFKRGLQNRLPLAAAIRGGVRPLEGDPRPGPAQPPDAVLFQARQLRMCKQVALGVAGAAAQKLGDHLGEAQGVLEPLANMMLEIYTLESGLLRAWKYIAARGEEKARHHLVAVQLYGSGAVPRIAHWARQVLAHVAPADRLAASLAPVNALAAGVPLDSIALRRQLAEKVIIGRKYPF